MAVYTGPATFTIGSESVMGSIDVAIYSDATPAEVSITLDPDIYWWGIFGSFVIDGVSKPADGTYSSADAKVADFTVQRFVAGDVYTAKSNKNIQLTFSKILATEAHGTMTAQMVDVITGVARPTLLVSF
jgi:hypothetical protein